MQRTRRTVSNARLEQCPGYRELFDNFQSDRSTRFFSMYRETRSIFLGNWLYETEVHSK